MVWLASASSATFSPVQIVAGQQVRPAAHSWTVDGHVLFANRATEAMSASQALVVDPERTFVDNLPVIDRVIATVVRRHALPRADADEFASWARARIIDADYAVFRKFAGRSSLSTYLSVVITNLFRDYRNSVWGRWRPSAAAARAGPMGIRLEELISRDGHSLREAIGVLQSAGVALSDTEIARLAAILPPRTGATEVGLEEVDAAAVDASPPPSAPDDEAEVIAAVRGALAQLPPEEQLIVRMRFWDDISVADIARTLHTEQKPLYRKLESIQSRIRTLLATHGIDHQRAIELLTQESIW
jgi:RNA polymerase sigma factor (sigma-70 family)